LRQVAPAMMSQSRNMSQIKFAPSHEFITMAGDIGTIGITAHAAEALGDIVYVDLPAIGTVYEAGESFGSVESVKAASDVYSPVSGEVIEINETLEGSPGLVNESPVEKGWFMKIKLSAPAELDGLMDSAVYKEHCDNEAH
jgi:glycine cleavage system H protein